MIVMPEWSEDGPYCTKQDIYDEFRVEMEREGEKFIPSSSYFFKQVLLARTELRERAMRKDTKADSTGKRGKLAIIYGVKIVAKESEKY